MGFVKFVFISSVLVVLSSVLLQKYAPDMTDKILLHPVTLQVTTIAMDGIDQGKSFVKNLLKTEGEPFKSLASVLSFLNLDEHQKEAPEEGIEKYEKEESVKKEKGVVMTKEELKKYDGKTSKKIYLALMGNIFDVSNGDKYYGPDGGYAFFAGCDASRAYVSGQFDEKGLIDDIEGLSTQDYLGLEEWMNFYKSDYVFVGRLIGRYFDEEGNPTEYKKKADEWIAQAKVLKANEENWQRTFPPCNSEWSAEQGSRVWCTTKSGGIEREWAGVPRQLFTPGHPQPRCACVKNSGDPTTLRVKTQGRGNLDHPQLLEYPDCPPTDTACYLPKE